MYTYNGFSLWYAKDISIELFKTIVFKENGHKKKRGGVGMNNRTLGNWYQYQHFRLKSKKKKPGIQKEKQGEMVS